LLRSTEKSQIFQALRPVHHVVQGEAPPRAVTGKNIFALKASFFTFSEISHF
jgi:hypothetical protein